MRLRPSYANVVSTLALVLVVSGGAYAATQLPKDSVGSKQIKNNKVKSKDLKDGGVTTGDVKDGTLTRTDLKAGEIDAEVAGTPMGGDLVGTFPNPTLVPGATAGEINDAIAEALEEGVVLGDRDDAALTLPGNGTAQALVSIPGVISVTAACSAAGPDRGLEINVTNDSAGSLVYTLHQQSVAPAFISHGGDTLLPGTDVNYVFPPDDFGLNYRYLRLVVLNGRLLDLEVSAVTKTLADGCHVRGSTFLDGNGPA